jgi:TolA-binding protein
MRLPSSIIARHALIGMQVEAADCPLKGGLPSRGEGIPLHRCPLRFLRLNAVPINMLLRQGKWCVVVLCLAGALGLPAQSADAAASRAESQALLWLERGAPGAGSGNAPLAEGLQRFRDGDYRGAGTALAEAARLGAGTPAEEAALFLMGENLARSAATHQDIRSVIKSLEQARSRFPASPRSNWALWRIGSLYRRLGFDLEAVATIERALRGESADSLMGAAIRLDLADAYMARRQYAQAARFYQTVRDTASSDDNQAEGTLGQGAASYALSQYKQARDLYDVAEAKWPARVWSSPLHLLALGDSLLQMRQWPRAKEVLLRGYNLHPRDQAAPVILAKFGDGFRLNGNPRAAKVIYHTLLERHPQSDGALLARLGLAELAEGDAPAGGGAREAREQYLAVVNGWQDRPVAVEALFRLGQSHQRAGELEAAGAAYDRLLERPDAGAWLARARGALEEMIRTLGAEGKHVEVATLYYRHKDLLSKPTLDLETGVTVGDSLARLGLAGPAILAIRAVFTAALKSPHLEHVLVTLAEAYRARNEPAKAAEVWQEYLQRFSKGRWSPEAQEQVLTALIRSEKRDDAEQFCRQWLAAGMLTYRPAGDQAGGHGTGGVLVCADLLADTGDAEAARGLYEGILKSESDTADALWATYQSARALAALGQSGQAAELFGRVASTKTDRTLAAAAAAQLAGMEAGGAP